jgi:hypothetical protein
MADIHLPEMTTRHVACNVVLQLHGGIDPDTARSLSDRILFAVDRAGMRGHADAAPTDDEVRRGQIALARRGVAASHDDVRYALDAAFVRGWGS